MRVVLAGTRGFGAHYLERLGHMRDVVELAGVCDTAPPEPGALDGLGEPEFSADLPELIKRTGARIAILATPIPTHADLTLAALAAGAHVLVEKPTAATLADFERMERAAAEAGLACQVGFQSLGSAAIPAVRELIASGVIGRVTGIGVGGSWPRPASYFTRSPWAGRRRLDGVDVVDGALTNPFAHALATALAVAGAEERGAVEAVETELFHANAIESDDTSSVRVTPVDGPPIVAAVTLCAAGRDEPYVVVHGERGRIRLTYTLDEVQVDDGPVRRFGRTDLLRNLVAHVASGEALLVPIGRTGAFMEVMEAIRLAPDPLPIAADHLDRSGEGVVLPGVADLVDACADRLALFSELGASWATPLLVGDRVVAEYVTRPDLPLTESPRPYLHPVRTLGGTVVTEIRPQDHPHHLGAGVAVTDIGGRNFWGGRTYVRDQGPTWLDNHGAQRHVAFGERDAAGFAETLLWERPGEEPVVREERTARAVPLSRGWALRFSFTLRNLTGSPLTVRSSATKGRAGAGYGGFFWRAPAGSPGLRVFTGEAEGEQAVHGSRAAWLALSAEDWTLVFAQDDDPWFVRVAEYPGVGTALAWDTPLVFDDVLARRVTVVVADGRLAPGDVPALVAEATG
ncbi:PmoA family protein [Nonomuraea sp. RK-328]|nr:PmoA family protein [Nonomuraea sp. RK-328]